PVPAGQRPCRRGRFDPRRRHGLRAGQPRLWLQRYRQATGRVERQSSAGLNRLIGTTGSPFRSFYKVREFRFGNGLLQEAAMAFPILSTDQLRQQATRLPRVPLAHLPTPLEEIPRFASRLDG